MYRENLGRLKPLVLLGIIVVIALSGIAGYLIGIERYWGVPIILTEKTKLREGTIYGCLPLNENYFLFDEEEKARIYYTEKMDLTKWLKKYPFFLFENGVLYPQDVLNEPMSDCFILNPTKKKN